MASPDSSVSDATSDRAATARLFVLAALAGALAGTLGGAFRLALDAAAHARDALVAFSHGLGAWGWWLPVTGAAIAVALSRLTVRLDPVAAGSGIQYVEAVARGILKPSLHLLVIPVKFVGGVLSIGAGLALGREGPTVQMAARVGALFVRLAKLPEIDARMLRSAAAGAGLGVAFNAPLGGMVFVFEALWRGFAPPLVVSTLIACASGITASRLILGNHPDFSVLAAPLPPSATLVPALLIGVALGFLGAAYNRVLLASMDVFNRLRLAPEAKAAAIGAFAGLIAWFMPQAVGGGERLVGALLGHESTFPLDALLALLALRVVLSPLSYATGTPGGLFAPILVIGAFGGAIGLRALAASGADFGLTPDGAALVGMTAFLTAVVRSPLTGIALVIEMTMNDTYLVPMLAGCFAAAAVCELLRSEPIYETLIERIPRVRGRPSASPD